MMPLDSLINPDDPKAAVIPGYGPLPAELARDILASSQGRKWWRRLFTAPCNISTGSGPIVSADSTRRYFDGWLAKLIRHLDHITRHSDGGPTSFANGRGACARGNLVREMPGWHISLIDCGFHGAPHKIIITTPTGHHYLSRSADPP